MSNSTWGYFKTKEFFIIIGSVIGLILIGYFGLFKVFLPIYTNHGEEIVVPDVTGMTIEEAREEIEKADLRFSIEDSTFKANLEPLTIVTYDPLPGSKVKPNRQIHLIVNRAVPPAREIPDILNKSTYQAMMSLKSRGFEMDDKPVIYVPGPYQKIVIAILADGKDIKPGDKLPQGTKIQLKAYEGRGTSRVPIPKLVGMNYQEAITQLTASGFNQGSLNWVPGGEPAEEVFKQYPAFFDGDSLPLGSTIDLFINGVEPEQAEENVDATITNKN